MKKITIIGAGVLAFAMSNTFAATGVSADLGTTGLGLHVTMPIMKDLNARVGGNFFNYSYDSSTSDLSYRLKLKLQTFDALLDWFPMSNSFHVTGGLVFNGNKFDAHGKPNAAGNYTINGNTYSSDTVGTIDGKIDFRNVAPYLGIGFGNPVASKGWGFVSDIGVTFQGSPRSSLASNNCQAGATICDQFAADVATENVRLQDKVDDFKLYPVVRVGVRYTF